jgi:hypothetical protein
MACLSAETRGKLLGERAPLRAGRGTWRAAGRSAGP